MNHLTAHPVRRAAVGVLAGTLACTGAIVTAGASPANAVEGFAFERLNGDDRFETAAAIAADTFPNGATTAIIARSDDFADALTGNYLAGTLNAPVLLTRTGDLPSATADALAALGVDDVVIVGGDNAVSPAVEATLREDYTVRRLAGTDRYLTAQAVAEDAAGDGTGVGEYDALRTAVLGNGQDFPDVLAAGPLGYAESFPITITRPADLPDATAAVLADLEIEQVIVVGGDTVVSPAVRAEVEEITGNPVIELEGANRFLTANAIADFAYDELDFDATHVNLARSDRFADALAGGPHAGEERAPILLTTPDALSVPTRDYLASRSGTLTDGHIFGGTAAVSDATKAAAEQAASGDGAATGLSVTPDTSQTLTAVANPDSTTADDRSYSVSGLTPGQEYRITLVKAENTSTNADDETVYEEDGTTGLAATGGPTADITTVNGRAAENNTGDGTALSTNTPGNSPSAVFAAGAAGTATFVVDGDGAESVRPVVYRNGGPNNTAADGGTSPRLNLNDDGTAADEADTGGIIIYRANAAASTTQQPELVAAQIVDTVDGGEATTARPRGTTVRYTFDETFVRASADTGTEFHVYTNGGADGGAGTVVEGSTTDTTVTVRFADVDTDREAALLTVATVDASAVTDASGLPNPEGDAPLGAGTAGPTALTAGTTEAPDLVSISAPRAGTAFDLDGSGGEPGADEQATTAVDFVFDERAFVNNPDGFTIVLTDGTVLQGTGPAVGSTQTGGTRPGGNGTTTITVLFQNPDGTDEDTTPGGTGDATLTSAQIARGVVADATVADAQQNADAATVTPGTNGNVLQAAPLASAGNTTDPDLVSVALEPTTDGASTTAGDQALFTFDQPVALEDGVPLVGATADPASFRLYKVDGTQVTGTTAEVVSADFRQVRVTFAEDDAAINAVGGNVLPGAVFAADADGNAVDTDTNPLTVTTVANDSDEEGVTGTTGVAAQAAGRTAGPDLTGVALSRSGGTTGDFRATYTFDEDVTTAVPGNFFLYLADGTPLVATTCAAQTGDDDDNTVICTAFSDEGTAATSEQVGSAVLGTVDDTAVLSRNDANSGAAPATDTDPARNVEGAEPTTGGTGTVAR